MAVRKRRLGMGLRWCETRQGFEQVSREEMEITKFGEPPEGKPYRWSHDRAHLLAIFFEGSIREVLLNDDTELRTRSNRCAHVVADRTEKVAGIWKRETHC